MIQDIVDLQSSVSLRRFHLSGQGQTVTNCNHMDGLKDEDPTKRNIAISFSSGLYLVLDRMLTQRAGMVTMLNITPAEHQHIATCCHCGRVSMLMSVFNLVQLGRAATVAPQTPTIVPCFVLHE